MGRDVAKQTLEGTDNTQAGRLASNALQAEANSLRGQPGNDSAGVILVTVQPKDTIRSIGRFLFQRHLERAPTDLELKNFVEDTARRNNLNAQQRDNLALDQKLYVKIPGIPSVPQREVARAQVAHKPEPARVHALQPERAMTQAQKPEQPRAEAPKRETPQAAPRADAQRTASSTTQEVSRPATRAATTDQACSGYAQQIGSWITHNEAGKSKFTAYNPDDAGSGISVGLMQWNQKAGKLPELIKAWQAKNPGKFDDMFGGYSDDMLSSSWVRSADFVGNRTLASGITRALNDNEFQQVQLTMRNGHIRNSCLLANEHRFTSVRGTAVVADLVNQIGAAGTARALRKVPIDMPNESLRIEELKRITGWRTNSGDRVDVIEDRVREIWRTEAARSKGD